MDLANNIVNNLLDIIKELTLEKAVLQARLDAALQQAEQTNAAKQELETKAAELERTILDISKPVEEED
ncbi:MAG: hypothetical protein SPK23_01330 [Eubacteriales bacterium]|nr:hypothetical protein [Eubacteriales bacterium]